MDKAFSFRLFTDPHYYDKNTAEADAEAFRSYCINSPRCVIESEALLDRTIGDILADNDSNVVLIAGDLTHWGERECHEGFRDKLEILRKNGKKVYLITATHDYGRDDRGGPKREELAEFYKDYGFSEAISVYERDGLSYVAQLDDGIRLLALNSDGNTRDFRGLWDDQLEWAKQQIAEAHASGNYIFAMMHYPLLPGNPVMGVVRDAVVADWEKCASFLADAGLDLIFTGHMHMQSLNTYTSPAGNRITDVCTGALIACPPAHRKITFTADGKADIRSTLIESIDYPIEYKTVGEYADVKFCGMINGKVDQMETDYAGFVHYLSGKTPSPKLEKPINFLGRTVKTLTLGKLSKLLMIKLDPSLKDVVFKDLLLDCVLNMFKGDEPYTEGTPEYEFFKKLLKRLALPVKLAEKKLAEKNKIFADIPAFVFSMIGDENKLDNNAVINIKLNEYKK